MRTGTIGRRHLGSFPGGCWGFAFRHGCWPSDGPVTCPRVLGGFLYLCCLLTTKVFSKNHSGVLNMPRLHLRYILMLCNWVRLPKPPSLRAPRRLYAVVWGCVVRTLLRGRISRGNHRPGQVFPRGRPLWLGGWLIGQRKWRSSGNKRGRLEIC